MPSLVSDPEKEAQQHALDLVTDLYGQCDIEFQRYILDQLQTAEPQNVRDLLRTAFRMGPIQTDEVHAYLAEVFCSDGLALEIREIVACRILTHYLATFPLSCQVSGHRELFSCKNPGEIANF